eukprot:3202262-Pyramimonas_sp.AAC.2
MRAAVGFAANCGDNRNSPSLVLSAKMLPCTPSHRGVAAVRTGRSKGAKPQISNRFTRAADQQDMAHMHVPHACPTDEQGRVVRMPDSLTTKP